MRKSNVQYTLSYGRVILSHISSSNIPFFPFSFLFFLLILSHLYPFFLPGPVSLLPRTCLRFSPIIKNVSDPHVATVPRVLLAPSHVVAASVRAIGHLHPAPPRVTGRRRSASTRTSCSGLAASVPSRCSRRRLCPTCPGLVLPWLLAPPARSPAADRSHPCCWLGRHPRPIGTTAREVKTGKQRGGAGSVSPKALQSAGI